MKMISAVVLVVALALGALWWVTDRAPVEPIAIDKARVRLTPGPAPMAGYFVMRNHTEAPARLVGVRSGDFERVMIHRTVVSEGSARMVHQAGGVLLAPGESASFEPGGLHLMLIQPRHDFEVGDSVELVLVFDGDEPGERRATFTVVPVTSP